uniref:Uncharacterized protein n=1 Tax=Oryzias melastigma TaxID=30732 RepID=A0A3B3E078_ORYME
QYKATATDVCGDRLLKTLLTPITVTSATFLQHVLSAGHKGHLCSAANVCSTERMRRQMKKHYLNVLHACIQSGVYSDSCKRNQNRTLTKDLERDSWWTNTPQPQRTGRKRALSDLVLPKIYKR